MLFLYMRICTFPYRYFKMGSVAQMIKDFVHSAGDLGTIPGLGRSPGERYGYPLQCSCQENPMDRGAWQVTVHGVAKSQTWQKLMLLYLKHYSTPGEGNGTPLQYPCLENPMGRGAWWAAVHGVMKSQTRLSDFTFTFHFPALEKDMATHSSVLAWRIPGMGEPGGQLSMGSHRVGHDWSDLAAAAAVVHQMDLLDYFTLS